MGIGKQEVVAWLKALRRVYAENREYLTGLDSAIGDADHGINLDRGFRAVETELDTNVPADIRSALQATAAVLIRTVGGASGPLYGTFFLRAAGVSAGKTGLGASELAALFQAGVEGVAQRGKAAAGDKTMLDTLLPAVAAMRKRAEDGGGVGEMLEDALAAAEAGMRSTIPMQARKGRASYLGERSIGHQDPGATSAWLLLKTAADTWRAVAG